MISDNKINRAYLEELFAALNESGVALITLPRLNHPSGGCGSQKRKGDKQENSRISTSEHVVEFGLKVEVVE